MSSASIAQAARRAQHEGRRAYDAWTAPIGSRVEVTKDDGSTVETVTESMPWLVGSGMPIIKVRDIVGGYQLARVRVLDAPASPQMELFAAAAAGGGR